MVSSLSLLYNLLFLRKSRKTFIYKLPSNTKLLDVGCGSHSPQRYVAINPSLKYVGIDIHEFNLDENDYKVAEKILFTPAEKFDFAISGLGNDFGAVMSSHNIEHTDNPKGVIQSMLSCLKNDGLLYMVFPSQASVGFPKRSGTLNFYDDATHQSIPVFDEICQQIESNNGTIIYKNRQYRPIIPYLIGFFIEPLSIVTNKVLTGTWSYYGFESVIIAKKINATI